jgi:hypothetical protein
MSTAVDFLKGKTTLMEMTQLPNRYSHHLYRDNYIQSLRALQNPNGPEAKKIENQAMVDALTGGV